MHFEQQDIGDYRIYTGATESRGGGYTAGVAVEQVRNVLHPPRRVYFNDHLSGGHLFATAEAALKFAMDVGQQAVRLEITNAM